MAQMEPKYQVFVSSTYKDLREHRQRVMFTLLEMNCIPAGMELFPAADESQWKIIQRVIDECDYYLLILGGRYGSIVPDSVAPNAGGMSYTEMEYRYALGRGIPILRFPHGNPKSLLVGQGEREGEKGKQKKLEAFRAFVQDGGTVKHWNTPDELGGKVATTLAPLLKKSDRPGWVRGDALLNRSIALDSKELAQGDEKISVRFSYCVTQLNEKGNPLFFGGRKRWASQVTLTWRQIFCCVAPVLENGARESGFVDALGALIRQRTYKRLWDEEYDINGRQNKNFRLDGFQMGMDGFETVKAQFRVLGWMVKESSEDKSDTPGWRLTPQGDHAMLHLRAVRKKNKRKSEA